jgi:hypothetical protein
LRHDGGGAHAVFLRGGARFAGRGSGFFFRLVVGVPRLSLPYHPLGRLRQRGLVLIPIPVLVLIVAVAVILIPVLLLPVVLDVTVFKVLVVLISALSHRRRLESKRVRVSEGGWTDGYLLLFEIERRHPHLVEPIHHWHCHPHRRAHAGYDGVDWPRRYGDVVVVSGNHNGGTCKMVSILKNKGRIF